MLDCCRSAQPEPSSKLRRAILCPRCGGRGREVGTITLKSLLAPRALERLQPKSSYAFCPTPDCSVVYFSDESIFTTADLKVPVFQKDSGPDVPVCYCFGWTRRRIADEITATGKSTAVFHVAEHIKAGRCGCDVNNPQGSCCLGNLQAVVRELQRDITSTR